VNINHSSKGITMKIAERTMAVVSGCAVLISAQCAPAQDWPQWRGANRDAKAPGFTAPKTWPKELAQKWKVSVGEGVSTPALVGDKLYVFARQEGSEIIRCLDAATGKELWKDKYESMGASGPAASFSGPRCSPTVADGKIVTLGVRGILSCWDATGKLLWRKEDFKGALPRFFVSSSPIVTDGLCVAQLGGSGNGGVIAYDLATGNEKWKWTGDAPAYASPVLLTLGGAKYIVTLTDTKVVALALADGKLAWETPFTVQRMGYNAATPIVDGQTVYYTGSSRGVTAVKFEKQGDTVTAKELWKTPDNSVQFNTPVLKNGFLYGLTAGNDFFCLNAQDGKTAWTAPFAPPAAAAAEGQGGGAGQGGAPGGGGPGGGGRGGRGGMGGGRGGYGSIVDAGSVLLALTPASQLVVLQSSEKAFTEVARIKVAGSATHAYPIASGNRLFIKDADSVTLWTVE
jgi:outer membrane protein assembly factor BamB